MESSYKNNDINLEKTRKEVQDFVDKHQRAFKYKLSIMALYKESKILETFLEGAPQSVLQLYIILQLGSDNVTVLQWFSIATSFLAFSYGTAGIYMEYPTKVKVILIVNGCNH